MNMYIMLILTKTSINKEVIMKKDDDLIEEKQEELEDIEKTGVTLIKKEDKLIHCLNIIGQIEGHYVLPEQTKATKYEHVIPQLVSIEQDDDIKGLLVILNTVGGDVEAGLAIAELISGMRKPTVSIVLGGGHSIGVPLAVSTDMSFIVPSATMTIHPVRTNGLVLGVPQALSYFQEIQDRITGFVVRNSNISEKVITKLMLETGQLMTDMGTVIDGNEAVEFGLIDKLGSLRDALDALNDMIEENNDDDDDENKVQKGKVKKSTPKTKKTSKKQSDK